MPDIEAVWEFESLEVDDLTKSHQRAPGRAPKSMTDNVSH